MCMAHLKMNEKAHLSSLQFETNYKDCFVKDSLVVRYENNQAG